MTDTIAPALPKGMTPGDYMRLRREAARLTIDEVAALVSDRPAAAASIKVRLEALEANDPMSATELALVDELIGTFPFEPAAYWMLVGRHAGGEAGAPIPGICRICACTWNDPCIAEDHSTCSWTDASTTLCSACVGIAANDALAADNAA